MKLLRTPERGEGKIGCMVTLLVLLTLSAVAYKLIPVYYSNNNLVGEAEDLGSRAGLLSQAALEQQLRGKAFELEIPEALPKGAMTMTVLGDKSSGTCVIRLHFTRKVDFFGAYTLPVELDKTIKRPYMDAR